MSIKAINGFKDILPDKALLWQEIESLARDIFQRYGMQEIRVPLLEKTELFVRSIGEATDVVEKEMYSFPEKGITMRPEATASIMRAYIEHGMHVQQPVQRLYTIGPMFRHERPQKGRQRQFHQLDCEIIGAKEPQIDAELIAMAQALLDALKIDTSLELNSMGCISCRAPYREKLISFLTTHQGDLCNDCRRRTRLNPLRVLDCKKDSCRRIVQNAPSLLDDLCEQCSTHFAVVQETLDELDIAYTLNRFMVRGLDYYTQTTFEFLSKNLGAQAAVGGGGRFNGLIEELGGPSMPGIGFAMGLERLVLLMEQDTTRKQLLSKSDLFIAALGSEAIRSSTRLIHLLRKKGILAAMDYSGRSLKAQMKLANRINARFTLIIGDKELEQGQAVLRNMINQEQQPFLLDRDSNEQCDHLLMILRPNFS
ncbi:MAG: histidine--tRNA ligase [Desulfobulbus propionicus]|nr:MAG: histidine--tRNA ligase [Desulfobulbus propionicus]